VFATLVGLLALAACDPQGPGADLVLLNGTVVTVDDRQPEAQAVAIDGDTIVAVGSNREIRRLAGADTEVIDLEGRLVLPGFIEGHGHFMSLGRARMILHLEQAATWDEMVEMVEFAAGDIAAGVWIQGRGWHQEKWSEVPEGTVEGVPTHAALSRAAPDNPVILGHASGHGSLANARAMELAGIDRDTPDPVGGEIVRDASGEPTGYLREKAQVLVGDAYRAWSEQRTREERDAEKARRIVLAAEDLLSKGITSFQDAGSTFETVDVLRAHAETGRLPLRLYVMIRDSNHLLRAKLADYRMEGAFGGFLTVRAVKRTIDGALGSHGAWLLEPYADLPTTGLATMDWDEYLTSVELAFDHGYQMATHAIGDRGNREVLDAYQAIFEANGNPPDLRWRIEHAQHMHPDDIGRFAPLGLIASMQAVHATSDGPWVFKRLGPERAESGAYMWRDLLDDGVVIANGTDVPVEDADPIANFHASVTRMQTDGTPFFPGQAMTRAEALRSMTLDAAYAAFEEDVKGSLTPGKYADVVVLSRDIMTVPEQAILDAEVDYTILGGRVVYQLLDDDS
jgi:predicted amidohydrolase YtcJ